MGEDSKQPLFIAISFFGIILLSVFLFTWGRLEYVRYSNCQLLDLQKHQMSYFQKLQEVKQKQSLFWNYVRHSWLNKEIEKSLSLTQGLKGQKCYGSLFFDFLESVGLEEFVGELIHSKEFQLRNEKISTIEKSMSSIAGRLKYEYHQRAVWMKGLYVDLTKMCQLKKTSERFSNIESYLSGACRGPAAAMIMQNDSCQRDLQRLHLLQKREEAPFLENYQKVLSKWPFVRSDLQEIVNDCKQLDQWVELN